jgi:nitroreductase
MSISSIEINDLPRGHAAEGVLPAILHRWSPRSFSSREVSPADLALIFEAARWAPSSNNEQPWRFLVGVRNSSTHSKIASALAGFNQAWAPQAAVLILGLARTKFLRNDRPNSYALYDLGAAVASLCLQATALGLHTHQMGGYDQAAARHALEIPEEYALGSVIALGYKGEPAQLANEELLKREVAPRERKPLTELVFSSWGAPADLA